MDPVLQHAPADEYVGAAVVSTGSVSTGSTSVEVSTGSTSAEVAVTLRGHFEPIDGHFRWYGRIGADDGLAAVVRAGDTVTLTTPYGSAAGRLSDLDPWGRFRISGTGRPPF
jgi:hypothetical protein